MTPAAGRRRRRQLADGGAAEDTGGGGGTEDPLALGLGQSDIFSAIMTELAGVISGRSKTSQKNLQSDLRS